MKNTIKVRGKGMNVKREMNVVDKNGTFFVVYQGKGYYYKNSKLVTFTVPENIKNGLYEKRLFTELGEFELIQEIDDGYIPDKQLEFMSDEFVKWDIEKNKLKFVLSSVSEDEIRPAMNGIYFDSENVVVTDGHKMIYTENKNVNRNCIASCLGCKRLWTQAKEIHIGLKCTKLVFADCVFYVEHIDGQFPNYKRVIPEFSDNYTVTLPAKKELEYFLKKAKLVNSRDPELKYKLVNKNNESEFVYFNVEYLLDIEKFGIDTLHGQDNLKPYTGEAEGMNIVIMPMVGVK